MSKLNFYSKIDDHGVCWGNTGQILARWRRPVASKVALGMLCWAMRLALPRRIVMAFKMAHDRGTLIIVI